MINYVKSNIIQCDVLVIIDYFLNFSFTYVNSV